MTETNRRMTKSEKEFLNNILQNSPSRIKQAFENFFVVWAASLLASVLLWLFTNWLTGFFVSFSFGIKSDYSIYIAICLSVLTMLYSTFSTILWMKDWEDITPKLMKDIKDGIVSETTHNVVEVKRFQEPEHGGFLYFLRMSDNRVLVLFDYESTELYMDGQNPLGSSFVPKRKLKIVKSPQTQFFVSQEFTGEKVDIPPPLDLALEPEKWPEPESWTDIPWESLESKLG